ncbi:MAG: hypothetical protein R2715_02220 [Ilumatobacteraceae bacterium]
MKSRSAVGIGAAVACLVTLGACSVKTSDFSSEAEQYLQTDDVTQAMKGVTLSDPSCDEPADTEIGTTFRCTTQGAMARATSPRSRSSVNESSVWSRCSLADRPVFARAALTVAALATVALGEAAGCTRSSGLSREGLQERYVAELVASGIDQDVAECVITAFFDGMTDEELRAFNTNGEELSDEELATIQTLGDTCSTETTTG